MRMHRDGFIAGEDGVIIYIPVYINLEFPPLKHYAILISPLRAANSGVLPRKTRHSGFWLGCFKHGTRPQAFSLADGGPLRPLTISVTWCWVVLFPVRVVWFNCSLMPQGTSCPVEWLYDRRDQRMPLKRMSGTDGFQNSPWEKNQRANKQILGQRWLRVYVYGVLFDLFRKKLVPVYLLMPGDLILDL